MTAVGRIGIDVDICRLLRSTPLIVYAGKEMVAGKHDVACLHAGGVVQKTGAAIVAPSYLNE